MIKTVVAGAVNWDINLFIKEFRHKGEEVVVKRITRVPGGKAGNTAVAAARLLGPDKVAIFASMGNDSVAKQQTEIFRSEGVVTSGLKYCGEAESGQAYIAIDDEGANVIHKYSGANALFTPQDLKDPSRRELISEADVIAIMDPPLETSIRLAKMAKELGKVVAWDPGVRSELGAGAVSQLLENVDYVVANEHETANLSGSTDPKIAAARLSAVNNRIRVIVKLGAQGCVMYDVAKSSVISGLDLSALGLRAVNTVGCGDAFLGAFISALAEGRPDREALRWGNCAGGLKSTRFETRGSPTREVLLKHV